MRLKMYQEKEENLARHGLKTIAELSWASHRSWLNGAAAAHGDEHMTEKRTVKVDGIEFEVELTAKEDGSWDAVVDGKSFNIEVPNAQSAPRPKRSSGTKKKKSGTVSANIPGKVVTVEVSLGDVVEEGQVILILEAMKMQNEIQAPISGTVISVSCEEGQAIEANVPLVVIEPHESQDEE